MEMNTLVLLFIATVWLRNISSLPKVYFKKEIYYTNRMNTIITTVFYVLICTIVLYICHTTPTQILFTSLLHHDG